jgi:zinc transport system substrate-binding protein
LSFIALNNKSKLIEMKHLRRRTLIPALAIFLLIWAAPAQAALKVFVSIAPQKYFVEKIGGKLVNCSILVPAGSDPHTYEPKPRQMAELSKAAVYFAVGIDFEKAWLKKISAANPGMRIVHTEEGIAKIPMAAHHDEEPPHQKHAEAEHHDHAGSPDPHIWLSPALVKVQAGHMADALAAADPQNKAKYRDGYASFIREIDGLDREFKTLFASSKDRSGNMSFIVFHPSWGYFAKAYGLKQVPIEMEGKDPKPAEIQKLIRFARKEGSRVIFVQPQFSAKSAGMIAREIGGQVVIVDPLALDWAGNLREVAKKVKSVAKR